MTSNLSSSLMYGTYSAQIHRKRKWWSLSVECGENWELLSNEYGLNSAWEDEQVQEMDTGEVYFFLLAVREIKLITTKQWAKQHFCKGHLC